MLSRNNKLIALSVVAVATLFVGCGTSSTTEAITSTSSTISGQLVDSYVEGATYECAEGTVGLTGLNGEFSCESLPVQFRLRDINLGEIGVLPEDGHVFPQDLVGVDRNDTSDERVVAMAQLLQSLDSDGNPENGITLDETLLANLDLSEDFDAMHLETYIAEAGVKMVDAETAKGHLNGTMMTHDTIESASLPTDVTAALSTVQYTLSEEVKNDLAYMGNEERLAYDIYNKLYESFPDLKQLDNIPTNSEIQHIASVKALVAKYELDGKELSVTDVENETLSPEADVDAVAGVYDISVIQDLYDALLLKGEQSAEDALQVGCMVEVTDIEDLDKDIQDAVDSGAEDVVQVFNFLRDGSYSHYWSFDTGLKNLGVSDGCCSLGEEYCKTAEEYPQEEKGNGSNEESGSGDCQTDDNSTTSQNTGGGHKYGQM